MASKLTANGVVTPEFAAPPLNPVTGQMYFDTVFKKIFQWNGEQWNSLAESGGVADPFRYRQIFTTGYVMAGYASATPWKNVNRMQHATDVMTNLGDLMAYTASYSASCPSKTVSWIFSAANAHAVASVNVIGMNHWTETGMAVNSANFLPNPVNDSGIAFKETDYVHVIANGTSQKFDFTTETGVATGLVLPAGGASTADGAQAINDEFYAACYNETGGVKALQFATDVVAADIAVPTNTAWGVHNQQKPINSKHRKGYSGNEGTYNGGNSFRVFDMVTATHEKTVAKPIPNSGEENYDMGQEHQYCMGGYDGTQNNRGHKFFYTTDSGFELGAGSIRTGVPGGSSGCCTWK